MSLAELSIMVFSCNTNFLLPCYRL